MSFTKLDCGITDSTIWMQPHDVLRVWIAMLAKADASGFVAGSAPALAHLCMVPLDRLREILTILESPDPDSRSSEDEGRRITKVEGGWMLTTYLKYRNARDDEKRREQNRIAQQKFRDNRKKTSADVSLRNQESAQSAQAEAEAEAEAEEDISEANASSESAPADIGPDEAPPDQLSLTPPAVVDNPGGTVAKTVLDAYHETLPKCARINVLNPKRLKRIQFADKLARQVCRQNGWTYVPADFWRAYFEECLDDPWLRGETPNPNNPRWKQNLGVLIAEDRFAEIMDRAIERMRHEATA